MVPGLTCRFEIMVTAAVSVPKLPCSLLVAMAWTGGTPTSSRAGMTSNPPPPARVSRNPATNATMIRANSIPGWVKNSMTVIPDLGEPVSGCRNQSGLIFGFQMQCGRRECTFGVVVFNNLHDSEHDFLFDFIILIPISRFGEAINEEIQ